MWAPDQVDGWRRAVLQYVARLATFLNYINYLATKRLDCAALSGYFIQAFRCNFIIIAPGQSELICQHRGNHTKYQCPEWRADTQQVEGAHTNDKGNKGPNLVAEPRAECAL